MTVLSLLFVLVGDLNRLAIMSTIPFLLTYAAVNYAYVSLAMTYDIQMQRLARFQTNSKHILFVHCSGQPRSKTAADYGAIDSSRNDLDALFPERQGLSIVKAPNEEVFVDQNDHEKLIDGVIVERKERNETCSFPDNKPAIINQPESWYSIFCNRWVSFVGMVINVVIIFPMSLFYALINVTIVLGVYFYVGKNAPGAYPGRIARLKVQTK